MIKIKNSREILNKIDINCQSSIRISDNIIIYFDPYNIENRKNDADYIFITHPHWDHLDIKSIKNIIKKDTIIVAPTSVIKNLDHSFNTLEIKTNKNYHFRNLAFKTIPSYNIKKEYHPKERNDTGYLITLNHITYYIPGDTDLIDEIKNIKADCIFLPIGGTYTMDKQDAVAIANIINPSVAIPIHYGLAVGTKVDALYFKEHLNKEITCKIYF